MRFDRLYVRNVIRSIEERISLTKLDLSGLSVLTEAATGAYAVTPVIAAMAGAREVVAYTKDSRFGKIEDVMNDTNRLTAAVGRRLPVDIVSKISTQEYSRFDIITNSGHLRPIKREHIMSMKPTAVIPLMYESWELRKSDIDLLSCRERGIRIAGTNEHNSVLDVFEFLGPLVVRALQNAFVPLVGCGIAIISNNAFGLPVARHLSGNQARVFCIGPEEVFTGIEDALVCGDLPQAALPRNIDACVVASTPSSSRRQTYEEGAVTKFIAGMCPTTCVHLWGDIDYDTLLRSGIVMVPSEPAPAGHQGLVMSGVGPEPVIRLIVGGLKVAEVLAKNAVSVFDLEFCQTDI
jgi:hypothetical protein